MQRWTAIPLAGLILVLLPPSAEASHVPPGTLLWGYDNKLNSPIRTYDVGIHTAGPTCIPPLSISGRGIAHDPVDGNLWYSFVNPPSLQGDGLIHKTTVPPGCGSVGSIPFGDGVGGAVQDSIGAIDVDPDDSHLWVAGYLPVGGQSFLYKVNRTTGAILQSCRVPFGGGSGGGGNDTLTVAKLSGLGGSGKYLLTDVGETLTTMRAIDAATCAGGGAGTIVATFITPVGVTGIDYEQGRLIATSGQFIYNLGAQPFGAIVATMGVGAGAFLEDITLRTELTPRPAPPCPTLPATIVGTAGNDLLVGTAGADVIDGPGGADIILGGGGADVLRGGDGNDIVLGRAGNDILCGNGGGDRLLGDDGDDTLLGGTDNDLLVGAAGRDLLYGEAGDDLLAGPTSDGAADYLDGGAHGAGDFCQGFPAGPLETYVGCP